jgi:hypothetical protein
LSDAVVAAGIASAGPLGIGVRHGWRRVGESMLVTSSAGNRICTLDDRPALEELREFARGIHPAILTEGGLGAALRTLARRSLLPV